MGKSKFFVSSTGVEASLYELKDDIICCQISDWGGVIDSIKIGEIDVVVGFEDKKLYENNAPFFGALVGRYANRIKGGKFTLDGIAYQLTVNNNGNTLHGNGSFTCKRWDVLEYNEKKLTLKMVSLDGEFGFPGTMEVIVTYQVVNGALSIDYSATTDKRTIINLTNHTYFNLDGSGNLDNHHILINSENYTEVDDLIPTGKILPIKDSVLDLQKSESFKELFKKIDSFDHNYILKDEAIGMNKQACEVYSSKSKIKMEVFTTEIALQLYTNKLVYKEQPLKKLQAENATTSFCLEAQHYADSPNHPSFPSTVLNPCETYKQITIYKFSQDAK